MRRTRRLIACPGHCGFSSWNQPSWILGCVRTTLPFDMVVVVRWRVGPSCKIGVKSHFSSGQRVSHGAPWRPASDWTQDLELAGKKKNCAAFSLLAIQVHAKRARNLPSAAIHSTSGVGSLATTGASRAVIAFPCAHACISAVVICPNRQQVEERHYSDQQQQGGVAYSRRHTYTPVAGPHLLESLYGCPCSPDNIFTHTHTRIKGTLSF